VGERHTLTPQGLALLDEGETDAAWAAAVQVPGATSPGQFFSMSWIVTKLPSDFDILSPST